MKIHSFTQPETNILDYAPWFVLSGADDELVSLVECKKQGSFLIGLVEGYDTPEKAKNIVNADILILKSQLPDLNSQNTQEYYWTDLIGLDVYNLEKTYLGKIDSFFETGANDVMVIIPHRHCEDEVRNDARVEILIPYILDTVIKSIDLTQKQMIVDWHEDWL